jgi:hypothetical protein
MAFFECICIRIRIGSLRFFRLCGIRAANGGLCSWRCFCGFSIMFLHLQGLWLRCVLLMLRTILGSLRRMPRWLGGLWLARFFTLVYFCCTLIQYVFLWTYYTKWNITSYDINVINYSEHEHPKQATTAAAHPPSPKYTRNNGTSAPTVPHSSRKIWETQVHHCCLRKQDSHTGQCPQ